MTLGTAQMMVLGRCSRQRLSRISGANLPKQRRQAICFPEGPTFDGREFGTTSTCLAFKQLRTPAGNFDGWRPQRDSVPLAQAEGLRRKQGARWGPHPFSVVRRAEAVAQTISRAAQLMGVRLQ
jgi:hypothetical protein